MRLVRVDPKDSQHLKLLYALLEERTPEQSISHLAMPTWENHVMFVQSRPYKDWWLVLDDCLYVGAAYLTDRNEIGIGIFKEFKGRGYGQATIKEIMSRYIGPFFANINPENTPSIKLFSKLGFHKVQVTYRYDEPTTDDSSRNGGFTFR